jgi:hypothetical protein
MKNIPKKDIMKVIAEELSWCTRHEHQMSPEYEQGYIAGIKQIQYFVKIYGKNAENQDED